MIDIAEIRLLIQNTYLREAIDSSFLINNRLPIGIYANLYQYN